MKFFFSVICVFLMQVLHLYGMAEDIVHAIADHTIDGQREIAIVIPTYNNSKNNICIKNIESVLAQHYDNYHVYIINDVSTDDTFTTISNYVEQHPLKHKVTFIDNARRIGAMANYYGLITQLPDHVIVINLDGDDWLAHEHVFSYINSLYENLNLWITYGQYIEYPHGTRGFCSGYSKKVIQENSFRQHGLPISHLRTYYAWLFKKLKKKDLMYQGAFVKATCDKVLMVPMIEMSGGRFKCVEDILYVYNAVNPLSDMRVHGHMQAAVRDRLFTMKPYEPLDEIITDFATDA